MISTGRCIGFCIQPLRFVQACHNRGRPNRMGGIGVAMENPAIPTGIFFKNLGNLIRHQRCTNRIVARGDALGH